MSEEIHQTLEQYLESRQWTVEDGTKFRFGHTDVQIFDDEGHYRGQGDTLHDAFIDHLNLTDGSWPDGVEH